VLLLPSITTKFTLRRRRRKWGKNTTGGTVLHPKDAASRFPPDTNVTTHNTMI